MDEMEESDLKKFGKSVLRSCQLIFLILNQIVMKHRVTTAFQFSSGYGTYVGGYYF